jgi:putative lipoic acid-binding regulatory protein
MLPNDETLLKFPCAFPIKVMGPDERAIRDVLENVLDEHAPGLQDGAISLRASSKGRFVSVTVTVQAQSKKQLDAIYQALSSSEHILVVL